MFTGLVEEMGNLIYIRQGSSSALLKIEADKIMAGLEIGASVAVNGVCLTVTGLESGCFTADVMAETLSRTNLGLLRPGAKVNLERALRVGDRLGGHIVTGHIDGVGVIAKKEAVDIATVVTIKAPPEVMRYVIKKGSIAIDGTSLTVVDFSGDEFSVSLIPHTASLTTLGYKKVGDKVNLESDIIGKYIERLMGGTTSKPAGEKQGLSLEFLAQNGFA